MSDNRMRHDVARALLLVAGAIATALAVIFGVLAINRALLPYNDEGRYFDAAESVVYTDGATIGYMVAALACAGIAGLMFYGGMRLATETD